MIATLGHRSPGPILSEVTLLALGLICILACTEAFRRSRGSTRYAWRLLAVAFVLWAVAQVLAVYIDISGDHSLDSLDEIIFFFSVLPFGMLPLLDPDGEPTDFDRLHILDFVQVGIVAVSIFFCFSPKMWSPATAFRIGPLIWSRNLFFDGLLVATFVVRAFLTKTVAVRSLFGRMALFLTLSGIADSYSLNPEHDLRSGGWFDLIWTALLAIPILIAATWKGADDSEADISPRSQRVLVNQVLPLLYPLVSFLILIYVHQTYPLLSLTVFALAFMTFAARVLIIQRRQVETENKYRVLFEDSADANWLMDEKGFLACNSAALQMFGYAAGTEIKHPFDISPLNQPNGQSSRITAKQKMAAAFLSGKERFEWLHQRKDGTVFPTEVCLTAFTLSGRPTLLATVSDITERKQSADRISAQQAVLDNERTMLRTLIDHIPDFMYVKDRQSRFVIANVHTAQAAGANSVEELVGKTDFDFFPRHLAAAYYEDDQAVMLSGQPLYNREEKVIDRKGGETCILTTKVPLQDSSGRVTGITGVGRDITRRKEAEDALLFKTALLEAQAETTIDGILVVNESNRIIFANKQFGLHFGIPDEVVRAGDDVIVRTVLTAKVEAPDAFAERIEYLYSHRDEKSRDEIKCKNGKVFDRYSAPLVDSQSHYRGRIWYFRDITDRKVAEQRVQYLAYYDGLTGLANRTLLKDRLTKALADARRQKNKVALLFLDLDGFKDINDSLGHSVGDLLLQGVAERLKAKGREQDTIARLGGDEFLVMLTHVRDVHDAASAAERFMDVIDGAFVVQGRSLRVSCSLGISLFPEHGEDGETLIKNADAAMYSAKQSGRNNFRFFTEDLNTQTVERLTLENGLRSALAREELFLMYQPQMDIATGRIIGLEALLRWQHPELGLVAPSKFIRIAENSGMIVPIGEWVIRTACSQARKWQDAGLPPVTVAVNVSAVQFRQEGFCELVKRVLRETGLSPQYLELELTESLLLTNAERMLSEVIELKSLGLTLAIDDFGTGYSNFTSLRRFGVGKLKIDRSFINDVATNPDDSAITAAIISMAKSLRLKVIAEGVENEAQMSFLREHHCDEIQGYYFSKPLMVDKVADKLRSHGPESHARCVVHVQAQASGTQS